MSSRSFGSHKQASKQTGRHYRPLARLSPACTPPQSSFCHHIQFPPSWLASSQSSSPTLTRLLFYKAEIRTTKRRDGGSVPADGTRAGERIGHKERHGHIQTTKNDSSTRADEIRAPASERVNERAGGRAQLPVRVGLPLRQMELHALGAR